MNQNGNGNRKLFWKKVSKENGDKIENCCKIKDGNGRVAQEELEVRRIEKEYSENLFNIDTQKQVAVHICGFDRVWRSN